MPKAYASTVIDAPADKVWATIRDFNSLPTWHEGLADSEIEGGRSGDQTGAIRSMHLKDGAHIRETLLSHSDVDRSYSYDFQTTPFDVKNYHATIRVTPVTDGNKSFVEWWTTFDCPVERIDEWKNTFANGVFQGGFDSLKKHLGGR